MNNEEILRAIRGPLSAADREQLALGVVYEASRGLETLAELRQRLHATRASIDGELQMVTLAVGRALAALAQLSVAIEEVEALGEQEADALAK